MDAMVRLRMAGAYTYTFLETRRAALLRAFLLFASIQLALAKIKDSISYSEIANDYRSMRETIDCVQQKSGS